MTNRKAKMSVTTITPPESQGRFFATLGEFGEKKKTKTSTGEKMEKKTRTGGKKEDWKKKETCQ